MRAHNNPKASTYLFINDIFYDQEERERESKREKERKRVEERKRKNEREEIKNENHVTEMEISRLICLYFFC